MSDQAPQKQFCLDLFGPGPFPGHGVRVNVGDPYQISVLNQGSLEDRARMGQAAFEHECECARVIGDDRVPMLHAWTGTEVFAAAFGSPVHRPADSMPFALPAVFEARQADALREPALDCGPLGEIFSLCDCLIEREGPGALLRICDIQSPFDIAALIWKKEAFFEALLEQPESVHRLLEKVTRTLIRFTRAFLERYPGACLVHFPELWLPAAWGACLSEDDAGSISTRHFGEYCLPYLQRLAHEFGGLSIHCCAAAQHQWGGFLRLPGMRYINLFHPTTSLEASIDIFSGKAVLVPMIGSGADGPYDGRSSYLEFVQDCLRLARPETRFFFITAAPNLDEARRLADEIKGLCGRS
jgi:uroporphyrinogen-III decarboxylase